MLIFMLGNALEVGGIPKKKVAFGGRFEGVTLHAMSRAN